MGRPSKGPRLRLHRAKDRATMWTIRDGQRTLGTGCVAGDRADAETKLAAYIAFGCLYPLALRGAPNRAELRNVHKND